MKFGTLLFLIFQTSFFVVRGQPQGQAPTQGQGQGQAPTQGQGQGQGQNGGFPPQGQGEGQGGGFPPQGQGEGQGGGFPPQGQGQDGGFPPQGQGQGQGQGAAFPLKQYAVQEESITDCTKFLNFVNGDDKTYTNECCTDPRVTCDADNKYIIAIKNDSKKFDKVDFSKFPEFIKLAEFNVANNGISEVPNSLVNLSTLKKLYLNDNHIEALPNTIGNLKNLEELYLNGNKIESLPFTFGDLTSLKILNLSNNALKVLPNEIFKLNNLEKIRITGNSGLSTKFIQFGNSTISNCYLDNVNIECYQPSACRNINDVAVPVPEKLEYKQCTREEIKAIIDKQINGIVVSPTISRLKSEKVISSDLRGEEPVTIDNTSQITFDTSSKVLFVSLAGICVFLIASTVIILFVKMTGSKKHEKGNPYLKDVNGEFGKGGISGPSKRNKNGIRYFNNFDPNSNQNFSNNSRFKSLNSMNSSTNNNYINNKYNGYSMNYYNNLFNSYSNNNAGNIFNDNPNNSFTFNNNYSRNNYSSGSFKNYSSNY